MPVLRPHALAAIASLGLHAAVMAALLTPWAEPTTAVETPHEVELVMAPPSAAAVGSAPARRSVSPVRAASKPAAAKRPKPPPMPTAPPETTPAPSEQMSGSGTMAAAAPSSAPGESKAPPGLGQGSNPPGYTLGAAHTPMPDYPWSARRRGTEGRVVLRLLVDAEGRPTAIDLVHSSGDPVLDGAAITALRQWRLRPALADGVPVAGAVVVPILFRLT